MVIEGGLPIFLLGTLGGIAAEAARWWSMRDAPELPAYASRPFYWILTLIMAAIGGALAWLQFGDRGEGLIIFQVGLAAPLVIQKLAQAAPKPTGAMGAAPRPTALGFVRGA